VNTLTPSERAGIFLAVHKSAQHLESALRLAASNGLTLREAADAVGVTQTLLRGLARAFDLEQYR
jgi:predicted DNA-binding protein (UPF0251 family)